MKTEYEVRVLEINQDEMIKKLEELAEKCNTINYEILSTIGSRVPRIFV